MDFCSELGIEPIYYDQTSSNAGRINFLHYITFTEATVSGCSFFFLTISKRTIEFESTMFFLLFILIFEFNCNTCKVANTGLIPMCKICKYVLYTREIFFAERSINCRVTVIFACGRGHTVGCGGRGRQCSRVMLGRFS